EGPQPLVRVGISASVAFDLLAPEASVLLWPGGVLRTAVPETAIDENRDLSTGERDICDPPWPLQHNVADPVTQAVSVKFPSESQLWSGVFLPRSCHTTACRWRSS